MRIAVASGKGGTGKTMVAVSLAEVAEEVWLVDCDVDAPNAHLFYSCSDSGSYSGSYKSEDEETERVSVEVPRVSDEVCTRCGMCADACRFGAIVSLKEGVLTFPELCTSCGACQIVCPTGAIRLEKRHVGTISRTSPRTGLTVLSGRLDVGEPRAVPIIERMKLMLDDASPELAVLDCPPGTSCPVVHALEDVDFCVLVAEPTKGGIHDLALSLELVSLLDVPSGVVLNKCIDHDAPERLCASYGVPVFMEIPYDDEIARLCSAGTPLARIPRWKGKFESLLSRIEREVGA